MEHINEIGPAIVNWNMESVMVENVILTFMAAEKAPQSKLSILIKSHYATFSATQYLKICLKYDKKIKVKKIPFFISFIEELKNPKLFAISIRTMLESERNKKLNMMIVKPVQPLGKKGNKEFYFGGFAHWELFTK